MYRRPLLLLIVITTFIRLLLAYVIELGNDEVYYYTYAQHLQMNYFDHPPGLALLIRITTANLNLSGQVFVRLGAIICAAVGTILIYQIGSFIKSKRIGWLAALLYNASIYCSIIAGTFLLPDSPQIIFWLMALWVMLIIIDKYEFKRPISISWWILFGIVNGLCIMCKIHGIFIWAGFGLFILLYKRDMLVLSGPYLAFIITLLIVSPIFFWNYSNHFVTYNYHSSRVGLNEFKLDSDSFLQTFLGQVFYNNPINVILIVIGIIVCVRKKLIEKNYIRLLVCCGLPIIIIVTLMSLLNPVLPHWSGPGFLTLFLFAAVYIDDRKGRWSVSWIPLVVKCSLAFIIITSLAGVAAIRLYPGTIGNKDIQKLGENDFTLDMYGWKDFGNSFQNWYDNLVQSKKLTPGMKIITPKWFPGSHIDYYVAPAINSYVIGVGEMNDLHHFVWLNEYRGNLKPGEDALTIVPSNYPYDPIKIYHGYFLSVQPISKFAQSRGGKICRYFTVYLLKKYSNKNRF